MICIIMILLTGWFGIGRGCGLSAWCHMLFSTLLSRKSATRLLPIRTAIARMLAENCVFRYRRTKFFEIGCDSSLFFPRRVSGAIVS